MNDMDWKEFIAWLIIGVNGILKKVVTYGFFLFVIGGGFYLLYLVFSHPTVLFYILLTVGSFCVFLAWWRMVMWARKETGTHPYYD